MESVCYKAAFMKVKQVLAGLRFMKYKRQISLCPILKIILKFSKIFFINNSVRAMQQPVLVLSI